MGLFSWFTESPKPRKRTSRAGQPKGPPKRTSRSTRKGYLNIKGVKAVETKTDDPTFKGRIKVERGSGFTEFPNLQQFRRIAKEEGVPSGDVEVAFGHMDKSKKRTSRKPRRRAAKPKTSRRAVRRNVTRPSRIVQRGKLYTTQSLDGTGIPISAHEVPAPTSMQSMYGPIAMMVESGGEIRIISADAAYVVLRPWFTEKELKRALSHLMKGFDAKYGKRSIKLGHRDAPNEGEPKPGIVKGQLVLYHKPSKQVVWEAWDDESCFPHKPIWIWYFGRSAHFDFTDAIRGAVVGRGPGRTPASASDVNIPPMAMLEAFGHLLSPEQRRQAYEAFLKK